VCGNRLYSLVPVLPDVRRMYMRDSRSGHICSCSEVYNCFSYWVEPADCFYQGTGNDLVPGTLGFNFYFHTRGDRQSPKSE
jgi:hypothetical protein